jgi:hypothetical protein
MLLGLRVIPRTLFLALLLLLGLTFLVISPFSGQAGSTTRKLVWKGVEKVKSGGRASQDGKLSFLGDTSEEEEALRCVTGLKIAKCGCRKWEYSRALQFEGSGARIQAFLDKASSGRPFTVSVIGGSGEYLYLLTIRLLMRIVSKGRGLLAPEHGHDPHQGDAQGPHEASTLYSPENLHVLIFDWLNTTFPNSENRLINGAQGGVGAGYFGWCFSELFSACTSCSS